MFIPGFMLAIAYIVYIVILLHASAPRTVRAFRARPMSPRSAPKLTLTGKVLVPPSSSSSPCSAP